MIVPVFIVAGIINWLAVNMNYNIPPSTNPDMDIRVRREIKFDINQPEDIDTPPDKHEQETPTEVLPKHKIEQYFRLKRNADPHVVPYEPNVNYNHGNSNNGTKKSTSIIKNGYQLILASLFKPSTKREIKLNTTHYNYENYYNNGYGKKNNGIYNQTGALPNGNYNTGNDNDRYNNTFWNNGVYNTQPTYNGNRNISYPYNQSYPNNYNPYPYNGNQNTMTRYNETFPYNFNRNPVPITPYNANYNQQSAFNGNYNTAPTNNENYNTAPTNNGNYNTAPTNNGYYTTAATYNGYYTTASTYNGYYTTAATYNGYYTTPSNTGNIPYNTYYNGASPTTYNGNYNTVTPYNTYNAYNGKYPIYSNPPNNGGSTYNGVPNNGNSQSSEYLKNNATTSTTTERVVAMSCIIFCSESSCPEGLRRVGSRCVNDYEDY